MMTKTVLLVLCCSFFIPSSADIQLLVVHSMTTQVSSCPQGFTQLSTGYSYLDVPVKGNGNGQDLSSPGSCLTHFRTIAATTCYSESTCDHWHSEDDFQFGCGVGSVEWVRCLPQQMCCV